MRRTETIPLTIQHENTHATCDLCGAQAVSAGGSGENDWSHEQYRQHETTVVCKDGTCYPDGGTCSEIVVDVCNQCFRNKLVPWLESQGAKIQEKEWDW